MTDSPRAAVTYMYYMETQLNCKCGGAASQSGLAAAIRRWHHSVGRAGAWSARVRSSLDGASVGRTIPPEGTPWRKAR